MRVFIKYNDKLIRRKLYTSNIINKSRQFNKYGCLSFYWDRKNSPAYIEYKNNKIYREEYWENNEQHNVNGYAIFNYELNVGTYFIDSVIYENEFEYWIAVGNYKKGENHESIY